jgi:predicted aspartyl protease
LAPRGASLNWTKIMRIKYSLLLALGGIVLTTGAAKAESIPTPIVPVGDIIATAEDDALRMTVPVMVNGQGPFQFVIDTGADRTVISSELAERLGLPEAGKARLHAMGGERDVRIVAIDSVQVSTNTARNVRAASLPARNLGADGLLGIDSLQGQRIIMDFKAQTMTVVPSSKNAPTPVEDEGMIVVTAKTRLGQLVMVDADANGQKVWVVVDTGAENSVGNSRLKRLMIKRNSKLPVKVVEMSDVLGKRTPADYIVVDNMRVGNIAMKNSPIAFADAHPFKLFDLTTKPAMLLGMEGLRSFSRVSVDFTSRKIKFLLPQAQVD